MQETKATRLRSPKATALALLPVLAMLVAPICAPLCAARACSTSASQEDCHNMTAMADTDGERLAAPSNSCRSFEFSAVIVEADEQTLISQDLRNVSAPMLLAGSYNPAIPFAKYSTADWSTHRIPLQPSDHFPQTTILRL